MKRTTKDLMVILGVTNKSVLRIAEIHRWERLKNSAHGSHVFNVSDAQIEQYVQRNTSRSVDKMIKMQDESTKLLLGLIDKRVCAVSFNSVL